MSRFTRVSSLQERELVDHSFRHHENSSLMCNLSSIRVDQRSEQIQPQTEDGPEQEQGCCCGRCPRAEIASVNKGNEEVNEKKPSVMSWGYAKNTARHVTLSIHLFIERLKRMSASQIILTLICIFLLMLGNVMQILMLNFWLTSFPSDGAPGSYTAFALPGIFYSLLFFVIFLVYFVLKKPNLRFAKHSYGWKIIILIGFYDTFNSWLATYSASNTSEMLQSLFANLSPLFSMIFSKWILHDPRCYLNIWTVIMTVFTVTGIFIVVCFNLSEGWGSTGNRKWFILIYFSSIPFRVLMNIYQSLYMIVYTNDSAFIEWLCYRVPRNSKDAATPDSPTPPVYPSREAADLESTPNVFKSDAHLVIPCRSSHSYAGGSEGRLRREFDSAALSSTDVSEHQREVVSAAYHQGDDITVKLVMLAGETFVQMCFSLAFLPADALPWFGGSATVRDTWTNFQGGIRSYFTIPKNFIYGSLYTLGFVFNYIGAAYVNHRSVTLCSLITQLSSPLTGLLLVIAPSLNAYVDEGNTWVCDLAAILILTFAALVYVVWEELTHEEMLEGERELKTRKLHMRPIELNDISIDEGVGSKPFD